VAKNAFTTSHNAKEIISDEFAKCLFFANLINTVKVSHTNIFI